MFISIFVTSNTFLCTFITLKGQICDLSNIWFQFPNYLTGPISASQHWPSSTSLT